MEILIKIRGRATLKKEKRVRCDSDFVDLILLLLLLRHELLDSVTGVLQIKNLRLLVFFSPRCYFFSSWTVEAAPASSSCFFQSEGGNVLQKGRASAAKKKKKKSRSDSAPFARHSVGDSIKSLPCDLFSQKQTASGVSQDQSHQRRAACVAS